LAADFRDGGAHAARVLFIAKIEKWLSDKWTGMHTGARPDGGFERCHGRNPFEDDGIRYKTLISLHPIKTQPADERDWRRGECLDAGERRGDEDDYTFYFWIFPCKVLIPSRLSILDSGVATEILAIKGFRGKILRNKELAIENDGWDVGVPLSELGDSGRIFHDFPLVSECG